MPFLSPEAEETVQTWVVRLLGPVVLVLIAQVILMYDNIRDVKESMATDAEVLLLEEKIDRKLDQKLNLLIEKVPEKVAEVIPKVLEKK